MSSPHSHNEEGKGYSPHMRGVALGILVMGISLAAVIILWTTFGYLVTNFSTQVMERQQERLHEQYGLPPLPDLSPETLQVPPSLRNVAQEGGGGGEAAQTGAQTTGGNQTGAQTTGGNQTGAQTTGGNQTGAQTTGGDAATGGAAGGEGGGGPTKKILEGGLIQ